MVSFRDEDEVATVIASHAMKDGTYLLPFTPQTKNLNQEEQKQMQAALAEKFAKGPVVVAAVRRGGFGSFGRALLIQFLIMLASAFLATWLLLQARVMGYARRVLFVAMVGLAAGIMVELPNWNWWGFSGLYTAVNVIDLTVMWALAGLVIASFARPVTQTTA
jgi:hypothetical protein